MLGITLHKHHDPPSFHCTILSLPSERRLFETTGTTPTQAEICARYWVEQHYHDEYIVHYTMKE